MPGRVFNLPTGDLSLLRMPSRSSPHTSVRCPELLAPAGSKEALHAAIAAGADAVYLGGRKFGARHFAANFSEDEIREAVAHAHLRGVLIYVTVNTLVQDRELPDVLAYLLSLYSMGIDALLIQDGGLLALARGMLPGLSLHASTQCTISTSEGVAWAGKAGFSRVVLARETPLTEIDRIMAIPPGERPGIEVFVHGALCYSYSGQCLLSSAIGGRSGNRGMCAQPCRKPYCLVRGVPDRYGRLAGAEEVACPDRFLLSTRDLCCYPGLREIVRRGVESLKIEGRMRSAEYVAAVVRAYRTALDALREGKEWRSPADMEEMATAFNRGFTGGYLLGERGPALMGRDRQDNRGLLLGCVLASPAKGGILVRTQAGYVPAAGDGILIADPGGAVRSGYALNRDAVQHGDALFLPGVGGGAKPGSLVFLTRSMRLSARLKETLHAGSRRSPIPATLRVRIAEGLPLEGTATCPGPRGGRTEAKCTTGFIPPAIKNAPFSKEAARRQLRKSGGTPFAVEAVDLDCRGDPFVPLGELNRLRRDILSSLQEAWLREFRPEERLIDEAAARVQRFSQEHATKIAQVERMKKGDSIPSLTVYCATREEIAAACEGGCDSVCYEPSTEEWAGYSGELAEGARYCREQRVSFTWKWPRITGPRFLKEALPLVPGLFRDGLARVMVEEPGIAEAILSVEPGMEVIGGQGLNIYNAYAARAFHPPISSFTLSPELSGAQAAELIAISDRVTPGIQYEIFCQGSLEVIVSEDGLISTLAGSRKRKDNVAFGLRDETGRLFPVYEDMMGRTRILNAVETTLIDRIPELLAMGIHSIAVDARGRGERYAGEMTRLYREGLGAAAGDGCSRDAMESLKDRARMMARGGLTSRHFDRGLAGYCDNEAE